MLGVLIYLQLCWLRPAKIFKKKYCVIKRKKDVYSLEWCTACLTNIHHSAVTLKPLRFWAHLVPLGTSWSGWWQWILCVIWVVGWGICGSDLSIRCTPWVLNQIWVWELWRPGWRPWALCMLFSLPGGGRNLMAELFRSTTKKMTALLAYF